MNRLAIYLGINLFVFVGCYSPSKVVIKNDTSSFIRYDHPNIKYSGRVGVDLDSTAAEMYWSGSSIKIDFEGTALKVILADENHQNYFNVLIDGNLSKIIRPDTLKKTYTLADNLPKGKHSIELFKRTEWTKGKTWCYGFMTNRKAKILPLKKENDRMIEFYGNSITCGYAVEDFSGKDNPDSTYTNNYLAFGAITARHFKADYTCIARSGIGLTISWYNQIMQDIYWRLDPTDSLSKWDFSLKTPDIVVVNLLQNDSWLTNRPEFSEFKRRFGTTKPTADFIISTYATFIQSLRTQYPQTEIICMLGNMDATQKDTVWPDYIQKAVTSLNDTKIQTLFIPYKESGGHPSIAEQQKIANKLIYFIKKKFEW